MRNSLTFSIVAAAAVTFLAGCDSKTDSAAKSDSAKPKYTIEEIMKKGFAGKDDSVVKRINNGTASKEDLKLMAELTHDLPLNKPEKGDMASWTEKSTALAAAADALAKGTGSVDAFKSAANCKACHSVHKPEKN
jgi:hypothetical protein